MIIVDQFHPLEKVIHHHLGKGIAHHLLLVKAILLHRQDIIHHLQERVIHRHFVKDIGRHHPLTGILLKSENALCHLLISNKPYLKYKHEYEKQFFHIIGLDHCWFGLQEGINFNSFNPFNPLNPCNGSRCL